MRTADASVLVVYKNFAADQAISHIGLGVAAMNNQKVLRSLGLKLDVHPILHAADLRNALRATPRTHVVISAPWIPTKDLAGLAREFPESDIFLNCHSNVGFLGADRSGITRFREGIDLQIGTHNFHVAGNSKRFVEWVQNGFGADCAWLPNLYYLDSHTPHKHHHHPSSSTLRIGIFGATRPLKNIVSAAAAALEIARDLRRPLELWLSAGRTEGGGDAIVRSVKNLLDGLPGITLHFAGWQDWPRFRRIVSTMHLLLQPSYTESFNMVTADGVAMGVPSVVSDAIDWAPEYWHADVDDVHDIATTGVRVLHHHNAALDGYTALVKHDCQGVRAWAHTLHLHDLPGYTTALHSHGSHAYESAD